MAHLQCKTKMRRNLKYQKHANTHLLSKHKICFWALAWKTAESLSKTHSTNINSFFSSLSIRWTMNDNKHLNMALVCCLSMGENGLRKQKNYKKKRKLKWRRRRRRSRVQWHRMTYYLYEKETGFLLLLVILLLLLASPSIHIKAYTCISLCSLGCAHI